MAKVSPTQRSLKFLREQGYLVGIVEKPAPHEVARAGAGALVSMNLWRFDASIFDAHLLVLEDRTLLDEVSRVMAREEYDQLSSCCW